MKGKVVVTSKEDEGRLRAGGGTGKRKKAAEAESPTAPPAATMDKPKRPPSAFFLFLSQSSQDYNQLQPGKEKFDVERKAAMKWASMSAQDKQPYVDQAGQMKQAYKEALADFEEALADFKEMISSKSLTKGRGRTKGQSTENRTKEPSRSRKSKGLDESLVGARIKVWWPDEKKYYNGVVKSFQSVSKRHQVEYDDGDVEVLLLSDEKWRFISEEKGASAASETDAVDPPKKEDVSDAVDPPKKRERPKVQQWDT